ncbi:hypothetical protein [Actinomadura physcomitrii]|uniref:hypothetical protein n=1 Tax=Actinomadura physcomitrii TaxID=2650748 RepID=UPI0019211D42|nr:hypothetical protein [Actinomadura physcomitrii]
MTDDRGYLLDNRRAEAGTRFEAISELFDPWTFWHLDALAGGRLDITLAPLISA